MEMKLPKREKIIINKIVKSIKEKENFLITTHYTIDGDAIGSEIAVYLLLKKLNKKVYIINQDKIPKMYEFLPETKNVKIYNENMILKKPEIAFVLDCGNFERIGKVKKFFAPDTIIINIDHHFSNVEYGNINWVSSLYSACGEMFYFLIKKFGEIDKKQATCIYTAILTDTGSFRYHFGEYTFMIIHELLKTGIDPSEISQNIYFEKPISSIKLLSLCLNTLKYDKKFGIIWVKITHDMYKKTNTQEEDTEGFIDFIRSIKEGKIVFLLKERSDGIKVSFRSRQNYNVDKLARYFGGGGHREASGCFLENTNIKKAEKIIIDTIKKRWMEL